MAPNFYMFGKAIKTSVVGSKDLDIVLLPFINQALTNIKRNNEYI